MKKFISLLIICSGCSTLFNPDKYNPNPTPVEVETIEEVVDTVRVDTIKLINGVNTIIILDTLKTK